jgi:hypothetical protein
MSVDPVRRFEHIRDLGNALLALADLRTSHIWAPAFGSGHSSTGNVSSDSIPSDSTSDSALVVVSGVPATVADVAPVRASSVRRAAAQSSRRRPMWGALALLVSGSVLLALAFGRLGEMRAARVVATPSILAVEFQPQVESAGAALPEAAAALAPLAVHSPVASQGAPSEAGTPPPIESRAASLATPAAVPAPPHGPAPRPAVRRVRRSDRDSAQ